jgi:hypothetical protein
MGGPGSGNMRFRRSKKKTVVEDCLSLDANRWTRGGILIPGVHQSGGWTWEDLMLEKDILCLQYELDTLDLAAPWMRVSYIMRGVQLAYRIRLTTTRPQFGGLRWWFICPLLQRNNMPCGRRVGQLHLPPDERYFGCRQCFNLTYTTSQRRNRRLDFYRKHLSALETDLATNPTSSLAILALRLQGEAFSDNVKQVRRLGGPASGQG